MNLFLKFGLIISIGIFIVGGICSYDNIVVAYPTDNEILNGMTVQQFMDSCEEVPYNELRDNQSMLNKSVKISGKTAGTTSGTVELYVDGDAKQKICIRYTMDIHKNAEDIFKNTPMHERTIYGKVVDFKGAMPVIEMVAYE